MPAVVFGLLLGNPTLKEGKVVIGYLRGNLLEKQPPHVLLDVNGVGYELEVPMTTLFQLPMVGEPLVLHVHLVVREDAQLLYGFYTKRDRTLFRELIRLNGVGPKLALALMSGMSVDEMIQCVNAEDTSRLMKVPGVGKKKLLNAYWLNLKIVLKIGTARRWPGKTAWNLLGFRQSQTRTAQKKMQ